MTPFSSPAPVPNLPEHICGLWDALEASNDRWGPLHAQTLAVAHTLAIALWQAGDVFGASALLKQVVDCLTSSFGRNHATTLAAKGDFAALLFELGRETEAGLLELEAFENARTHLGKAHAVTSVLAWNRALNCEHCGDHDTALEIIANELIWLLAEPASRLNEDQTIIRGMLAERLKWDDAPFC